MRTILLGVVSLVVLGACADSANDQLDGDGSGKGDGASAVSIKGTVLRASGDPARSFYVRVRPSGPNPRVRSFLTGDDGKYAIGDLAVTSYTLEVDCDRCSDQVGVSTAVFTDMFNASGNIVRPNIVLDPITSAVTGQVVWGGASARSLWVVVSQNGTEKGRFLTGDDGRYIVGNLLDGKYDVTVENDGATLYSEQSYDVLGRTTHPVIEI